MKQNSLRLLGLAASSVALLLPASASAWETRVINGYTVQVGQSYEPLESEDAPTFPLMYIFDSKGKPVRTAELNDRKKTEIYVKVLYYGPEDRAENYGATPLDSVDAGRYPVTFSDGLLANLPLRIGAPGAIGFRLSGMLNGRYFDELFVCGKSSQDPDSRFLCPPQAVPFPGSIIDAYVPSAKDPE